MNLGVQMTHTLTTLAIKGEVRYFLTSALFSSLLSSEISQSTYFLEILKRSKFQLL